MIIKEWDCMAHGPFDSDQPRCPFGCNTNMVQRVFRTPVAIQSAGYKSINKTFDSLAAEHGLTDMNNFGGQGMRKADWQTHQRLSRGVDDLGFGPKSGANLNEIFKPVGSVPLQPAEYSGLRKETVTTVKDSHGKEHIYGSGKTLVGNGIELNTPKVVVQGVHNGQSAGLPSGDA